MSDTYKNIVLADSPVAYYRLAETSGTSAADSSGSGYTGAYVGTPTLNQGGALQTDDNPSVDFNGSSQYVTLGTGSIGAALNGSSQVTIEAWINNDDVPSSTPQRIVEILINAGDIGVGLHWTTTEQLRVAARSVNTDSLRSYLIDFATSGEWHHIVGVIDFAGDNIDIYLDGVLADGGTALFGNAAYTQGTPSYADSIAALVGASVSGYYDGRVDEVAIYATGLSASRILLHYQAGIGVKKSPSAKSLSLAAYAPSFSNFYITIPAAGLSLNQVDPTWSAGYDVPVAALAASAENPSAAAHFTISAANIILDHPDLSYSWDPPQNVSWQQIYRLTLTGAADGEDDVELPMSSFQSRAKASSKTYIGAVVPYTAAAAAAITARPNGTLIVTGGPRFADGTETLTEIVRADFDRMDIDRGGNAGSITLHGYYDPVTRTAQTRTLTGVSYIRQGQTNMMRSSVDIWLRPGDTAYDADTGVSVLAESIAYVIGPMQQDMTVSDGN